MAIVSCVSPSSFTAAWINLAPVRCFDQRGRRGHGQEGSSGVKGGLGGSRGVRRGQVGSGGVRRGQEGPGGTGRGREGQGRSGGSVGAAQGVRWGRGGQEISDLPTSVQCRTEQKS